MRIAVYKHDTGNFPTSGYHSMGGSNLPRDGYFKVDFYATINPSNILYVKEVELYVFTGLQGQKCSTIENESYNKTVVQCFQIKMVGGEEFLSVVNPLDPFEQNIVNDEGEFNEAD